MAQPALKLSYSPEGISHATEAWAGEIAKPEEERGECNRQKEIEKFVRHIAESYERQIGELTAQFREETLNLRQTEERTLEIAKAAQAAAEVEHKFRVLAEQWYIETMLLSSYIEKILHPAYQKILTLNEAAIPLILRELQDEPNDWFWALRIITDDDPVRPEDAGDMTAMADAWLKWGRSKGYI